MKRAPVKALAFLAVALAAGFLLASQINGFLGISFNAKDLPDETIPEPAPPTEPEPLEPVAEVSLPAGALQDDLYHHAADALADSLETRTNRVPALAESGDDTAAGRRVVVRVDETALENPEAFRLEGDGRTLTVTGGSRLGTAYGMYDLADRLRAGEAGLFDADRTVAPAMEQRYVDTGAVGVLPDPAEWAGGEDYSHTSGAFRDAVLDGEPYVDEAAMALHREQFEEYVRRMVSYGYNGIVVGGFLEYVNFDNVGDGYEVYGPESEYRRRHEVLRREFGAMFRYADEMGLDVILKTDMLALTPPLEEYFERSPGGVDASDPELWGVYRAGMDELFETMPYVDGVMIRIGEAGAIYDPEGGDYYSELHVTTGESVRTMLLELTAAAAEHDKEIIFRTWTVGIGEAGDLHTNPETYERVLGDLDAPNLTISTKYVMGDYYSYLPLNPTLETGGHRRMIEFQARREYEGMGSLLNDLAPIHRTALQELGDDPDVEGVWLWAQDGGPWRAGPMLLYPFYGFWEPVDANVYTTAKLAWNPDADPAALNEAWVRRTLSDDPRTIENLTRAMSLSRQAILDGLYIEPYARQQVLALGLEPPPMMWLFEWDIVSGSSSVLSAVYFTARDDPQAAIAGGPAAVDEVRRMQELVADTDRSTYHDPELHDRLLESLDHQQSLFETLAHYRAAFLSHYAWLDTGNPSYRTDFTRSLEAFEQAEEGHLEAYGDSRAFPAYNFFAADIGMAHAERDRSMAWLGRALLLLIAATLLAGTGPAQSFTPRFAGKAGFRALWTALTRPWKMDEVTPRSRADWLVVVALPLIVVVAGRLAFSSFLSWTYLFLMLSSLALFAAALTLLNRRASPFHLLAAVAGVSLVKVALPTLVVALRGPGLFWYRFWTDGGFNLVYVTLATAAFAWMFFAVYATLRAAYRRSLPAALGQVLAAAGAPVLLLSALVAAVGLERALTAFNDEMAILPLGLSRILGITVHLDIPTSLPLYTAAFGLAAVLCGLFLYGVGMRRPAR